MANITVASATNFIPEIWANMALDALRNRIILANLVLSDSDVAPFGEGDVLHVPVAGTFVANNKVANANVILQVPTDSVIDITLNKHKEVSFLIEDPVRAQQNQDTMARYLRNAVIPIAEAIEADLFALYAGLSQSVGVSGTDLTPAMLLSAVGKFMTANVPMDQLYAILSTKDTLALLNNTSLAPYFAYTNPNAIRQGAIGPLYGAELFQSNMVPVVAGSPASTKNLLFAPDFAVLASRGLPTDSGSGVISQRNYQDPGSSIIMRMTTSYNPNALGVQVTLDVLYGVAEYRDLAGVTILT